MQFYRGSGKRYAISLTVECLLDFREVFMKKALGQVTRTPIVARARIVTMMRLPSWNKLTVPLRNLLNRFDLDPLMVLCACSVATEQKNLLLAVVQFEYLCCRVHSPSDDAWRRCGRVLVADYATLSRRHAALNSQSPPCRREEWLGDPHQRKSWHRSSTEGSQCRSGH